MTVAAAVVPLRARSARVESAGAELRLLARARTRAPLRLALARIAARLVATRAWERLGFARLADYARERTGLSARQIQDLAHTSTRVGGLPGVEAALVGGLLGWSQARLVARVATREDEARWIAFARRVRVRDLEHAVRAVDRGSLEGAGLETDEDGADAASKVGVVVRCTPRVRAKFHAARALARRVAGEALPIWACMEAVTAEALSALPVGAALQDGEGDCALAGEGGATWADRGTQRAGGETQPPAEGFEETCEDGPSVAVANVCAAYGPLEAWPHAASDAPRSVANVCAAYGPAEVARLLAGLETADAFELDTRLRRAVVKEQRLDADLAPLLAVVAPERLGLSPRKARALRRIERAAARCPELRDAFGSGRLSWVRVQAILPLLALCESSRVRRRWLDHAVRVSVRRLEDDVDPALSRGDAALPADRQTCAQHRDAEATMPMQAGSESESNPSPGPNRSPNPNPNPNPNRNWNPSWKPD